MADKPKTQNTLSAEEQKEQPAPDEARAKRLATFQAALDPSSPEYRPDIAKALDEARAKLLAIDFQPINDFLQELLTLKPFIKAELAKVPGGETLDDYLDKYTAGELLDMIQDPANDFAKILDKARTAAQRNRDMIEGQRRRRNTKIQAEKLNAIMLIKDNKLPFLSKKELWLAFAPGRIMEMGTLDPAYIDSTGFVRKTEFETGDLKDTEQGIPIQAYLVLNAIVANSVENVQENFVKGGNIRFYVQGVLNTLSNDPRGLLPNEIINDEQLDISRKTAGVLYLESLLKPLQNYIGQLPNGSRYSVFNYIGYDAESYTMEIITPYIYQLWYMTQRAYFDRQKQITTARAESHKPHAVDFKPLEVNRLFQGSIITEDPATIEVALYITNIMLAAGSGKKTTSLTFSKIIKNCPSMERRIDEINASNKKNKAAFINGELRKIARAYDLIMDPNKSDLTKEFDILRVEPTKVVGHTKAGKEIRKLIAPTKNRLNDKLIIEWYKAPTEG